MQGGMGVGVSFSGLAGAVASCNAIGIISTAQAGFAEPDFETNTLQICLWAIDSHIKRAKEIAEMMSTFVQKTIFFSSVMKSCFLPIKKPNRNNPAGKKAAFHVAKNAKDSVILISLTTKFPILKR